MLLPSKKISLVLFSLFAYCCVSIAQQWHTTIDILHPPQNTKLLGIRNLLIVNNAVQQPDNFGHANYHDSKSLGYESVDLSLSVKYLLFTLANQLETSREFDYVGLVDQTQNTNGSFYVKKYLTKEQIQQLCHDYQADAALVLNSLSQYDRQGYYEGEDMHYYTYLDAYLSSSWTLQTPSGSQQIINFSDTLYWENDDRTLNDAFQGLPNRKQALLDMCNYSAERFAQLFLPQWATVDRYLYENKDTLISEGIKQFTYMHWQKSYDKFLEAYNNASKNSKVTLSAAYAAANLALVSEIIGNLSQARQWASNAADKFSQIKGSDALQQRVNMLYYRRQIDQRIIEQQKFSSK